MTGRPKLCPKCRKLVGADDQTCYHCGADLGMRGAAARWRHANGDERGRGRGVVASGAARQRRLVCDRFGRDPAQRGGRVGRRALWSTEPEQLGPAAAGPAGTGLGLLPVSGGA